MRSLKTLLLCIASATVWPTYFVLAAYMARIGPWPRGIARPASYLIASLAIAFWVSQIVRSLFRPEGWAEETLGIPRAVTRQVRAAVRVLIVGGLACLVPRGLLEGGLLAPSDRPISASVTGHLLGLAYGLVVWAVCFRLLRKNSPLIAWIDEATEKRGWVVRHRRQAAWTLLGIVATIVLLDASGYAYTARRLATAGLPSLAIISLSWAGRKLAVSAIEEHSWRWLSTGKLKGVVDNEKFPEALCKLVRLAIPAIGLLACGWVWEVDLALFRSIGGMPLWPIDQTTGLTVGDATQALVMLALTALVWKHISTLFELVVFPRMSDDPGTRYAILTLGRYLALAMGTLGVLSAVKLGVKEIGVVLAALGVGLGFGLQEIVSNFVSGIILLLERPIRVGDLVTVAGMTGTVDRINIRATTINNADNHSMIVPNRAFITGDLVNWTLKDKVIRVSIPLRVAQGSCPDRATDLLLMIAREDADVLRNPLPIAFMEGFGESSINLILHVHVPDPSLGGRVKHRLCTQIQKRFEAAGILMPPPTREVTLRQAESAGNDLTVVSRTSAKPAVEFRADPPVPTPTAPHMPRAVQPAPTAPIESRNRCEDE
ncbi:mechanosensitive ion channel [Isosphaeraceae bacterium EP7]